MARNQRVEAMLLEWAAWITVGDGSGYPTKSVLHPAWNPPSPGLTPTLKVSAPSSARAMHKAIGKLSVRLANTLVVHYVLRLPPHEQALRLRCSVRTVHERIDQAHRTLADGLRRVVH